MILQPALFEYLSGIAELTAVVDTKIYPQGAVPTGTEWPYVTYFVVDNTHVHNQQGPSGLADPRVQLDAWAETEYAAVSLFDILRRNLDGFRGAMGSGGNEIDVKRVVIDSDREQYIPPDDGTQRGGHRVSGDFFVWFVEGV